MQLETSQTRQSASPAAAPADVVRHIILNGVSWHTYQGLLAEHEGRHNPRFTYDRGALEIMVLSLRHEKIKHILALLIEMVAEIRGKDIEGAGSTTFQRHDLERGFEPDACFYIEQAPAIRQKDAIDLAQDPPPDLVVEIDITHPSMDKLPLLASLGIPEVWLHDGVTVHIFILAAGKYVEAEESAVFPSLSAQTVTRLVAYSRTLKRTDWVRRVREWGSSTRPA